MEEVFDAMYRGLVALCEEGVDRNRNVLQQLLQRLQGALCEEGGERNPGVEAGWTGWSVALCEEGVDRNTALGCAGLHYRAVALCEEGVDRNLYIILYHKIAIVALCEEGVDRNPDLLLPENESPVALCEEGVDRNLQKAAHLRPLCCRPLRRGRG